MEKSDLIAAVANQTGIGQRRVRRIVNATLATIELAIKCDEEVNINGFGKFIPRQQAARTKHNPKTLEKVEVPAKRVIGFRPSRYMKDRIA